MSREKHVRKLIEITIQEFAARTFSTSLGTQHAKLLSLCPIDGVKFSFKIPERICRSQSVGGTNINFLPMGSALAVMDELSTYAFMSKDKTGRAGVSIHLSTEYLKPCFAGETVIVSAKSEKTGKTIGFCNIEVHNEKKELVARGKHIKYLPLGFLWDSIASPTFLPVFLSLYENQLSRMRNAPLVQHFVRAALGGDNMNHNAQIFDEVGNVGHIFDNMQLKLLSSSPISSISDTIDHSFTSKPGMNNIIGRVHGGAVAMAVDEALHSSCRLLSPLDDDAIINNAFMTSMDIRYLAAVNGELFIQSTIDPVDLIKKTQESSAVKSSLSTSSGFSSHMKEFQMQGQVFNSHSISSKQHHVHHHKSICAQYHCSFKTGFI